MNNTNATHTTLSDAGPSAPAVGKNSPAVHAIVMTDVEGGSYTHLRPMRDGLSTCHYQATKRGILYEVITDGTWGMMGMCDPETRRCMLKGSCRRS